MVFDNKKVAAGLLGAGPLTPLGEMMEQWVLYDGAEAGDDNYGTYPPDIGPSLVLFGFDAESRQVAGRGDHPVARDVDPQDDRYNAAKGASKDKLVFADVGSLFDAPPATEGDPRQPYLDLTDKRKDRPELFYEKGKDGIELQVGLAPLAGTTVRYAFGRIRVRSLHRDFLQPGQVGLWDDRLVPSGSPVQVKFRALRSTDNDVRAWVLVYGQRGSSAYKYRQVDVIVPTGVKVINSAAAAGYAVYGPYDDTDGADDGWIDRETARGIILTSLQHMGKISFRFLAGTSHIWPYGSRPPSWEEVLTYT